MEDEEGKTLKARPVTKAERHFVLKLFRARTGALCVLVAMAVVVVLIELGIPLRSLQVMALGAAVAAMGFHHWADVAIEDAYRKRFGRARGEDEAGE
jgi:hypothetical protein